jgi:copper chaperone
MSITNTYVVGGMSCEHCVGAVSGELGALEGVTSVSVDLATGEVVVTSDAALDRATVAHAVEEAGYELAS